MNPMTGCLNCRCRERPNRLLTTPSGRKNDGGCSWFECETVGGWEGGLSPIPEVLPRPVYSTDDSAKGLFCRSAHGFQLGGGFEAEFDESPVGGIDEFDRDRIV